MLLIDVFAIGNHRHIFPKSWDLRVNWWIRSTCRCLTVADSSDLHVASLAPSALLLERAAATTFDVYGKLQVSSSPWLVVLLSCSSSTTIRGVETSESGLTRCWASWPWWMGGGGAEEDGCRLFLGQHQLADTWWPAQRTLGRQGWTPTGPIPAFPNALQFNAHEIQCSLVFQILQHCFVWINDITLAGAMFSIKNSTIVGWFVCKYSVSCLRRKGFAVIRKVWPTGHCRRAPDYFSLTYCIALVSCCCRWSTGAPGGLATPTLAHHPTDWISSNTLLL